MLKTLFINLGIIAIVFLIVSPLPILYIFIGWSLGLFIPTGLFILYHGVLITYYEIRIWILKRFY